MNVNGKYLAIGTLLVSTTKFSLFFHYLQPSSSLSLNLRQQPAVQKYCAYLSPLMFAMTVLSTKGSTFFHVLSPSLSGYQQVLLISCSK